MSTHDYYKLLGMIEMLEKRIKHLEDEMVRNHQTFHPCRPYYTTGDDPTKNQPYTVCGTKDSQ